MREEMSVKKIAEMAGVSVATVSRVINQNGRFSKETEERVRKIIEETHYIPNHFAKGLRTNRSNTIGIIVPDITNEYFSKLIRVIQMTLFKDGYQTVICNTNENRIIEEKCLYQLKSQSVNGIIYINGSCEAEKDIIQDICTIYIDRSPSERKRINTAYVSSDNYRGGRLAAKELIGRGCSNMAVIMERKGTYVAMERLRGFVTECREHHISLDPDLILTPREMSYEEGYRVLKEILQKGKQLDGVFCETDCLASGALSAIKDSGIAVPDRVKLIGFDNVSISYLCRQPFTTIAQDVTAIGEYVAMQVMNMVTNGFAKTKDMSFPVRLIKRETT
ncbi:MAG: LacI family DNA-binding transcriptional regulator [Eubacteriales bacterium]|nr:LacI family DNA-binding transcriptional regulator [Eubacteriales bacterium]